MGAPTFAQLFVNEVITEPDPTKAAALARDVVGPKFGHVILAPLGVWATETTRRDAVQAACAGLYDVTDLPGTWATHTPKSSDCNISINSLIDGRLYSREWRISQP